MNHEKIVVQELTRGSAKLPDEAGLDEEVEEFKALRLILDSRISTDHWLRGHKRISEFKIGVSSILPEQG